MPESVESLSVPSDESNAVSTQPLRIVEHGETRFTLLGTAHVSKTSAQEVERLIATGNYDAVALELDQGRFTSLTQPEKVAQQDLFQLFKEGKASAFAAGLALGAFQQRLADQMDIRPGEEFRVAIAAAEANELPLLLIDRDIGITLRRVYANVPWWQRFTLLAGLMASVVSREEISEQDIEKLKEGDMLEATFSEFAEQSAAIFEPLISERDTYMAVRLQEEKSSYRNVLVVVGAGHLKGLAKMLAAPEPRANAELRSELERLPRTIPWLKVLPWLITALVLVGFALGFSRSPELGWTLVRDWVVINGGLAALGAVIATAHPFTVLGVFLAAPLTSLNPLIGAGFVAAGIELWIRRPQVADFQQVRQAVVTTRGWWRNRVTRTLLVFFFATLGSALGTYLAGFRIFERLFG